MATTQGMSGVDLRSALTEWRDLLPLWVYKVYQVPQKTLIIRLHGKEHARHQLLVEAGRRAHLTSRSFDTPRIPPSFAMLMRKHVAGGKVLDIRQHGIQRIFVMDIGKKDREYHLVVELFDEGNVILCDQEYTIIQPLSSYRFKDRDIVAGARYVLPPADPTTFDREGFAEFLGNDERDTVRALAVGGMLGGQYAEYLCRTAGIDKNTPAPAADADSLYKVLHDLISRAERGITPVISGKDCLPFPLGPVTGTPPQVSSFNAALDTFYPPVAPVVRAGKAGKEARSREDRIRARQAAAIEKFKLKIARSERAVEEIYAHYPLVQEILETLRQASLTRSWQEIDEILKSQKTGPAGKITAVHPDKAAIEMDLEEKVTLYVQESVEANAGRYYDEIKKYKKKIRGAEAAMEKVPARREKKPPPPPSMKKRWYHRFRWFFTSDGVLVVGGRDASQNEELVKRYMEGGDLFVHADVHGASVVIVKGKTGRMEEVAVFAASYSGAWRSGHFAADVYSAGPEQVSKTPESGEYVSRGSFIVRGERTYYRDVPLGVAIGLQQRPEVGVIGGPPAAVKGRTALYVELQPGRFEPNDTAKKVLRTLRERLGPEEERALKGVLNTEAVAAFVPPGGSDIVGEHEG